MLSVEEGGDWRSGQAGVKDDSLDVRSAAVDEEGGETGRGAMTGKWGRGANGEGRVGGVGGGGAGERLRV